MMASFSFWQMLPWYVMGVYWVVSAAQVKTAKAVEPVAARLYTRVLMIAAFALLFSKSAHWGGLNERFLVRDPRLEYAGLVLTYAGIAFACWARWRLAGNWSAEVSLKSDHELIRSGPYGYVRHPIYSGMLLAVIGTALTLGEWRALLAILLMSVGLILKATREEAVMIAAFGEAYRTHQDRTGFLLPRF
jgi:protein-S-isoprenylcysteine O-methyltransferase Ste14